MKLRKAFLQYYLIENKRKFSLNFFQGKREHSVSVKVHMFSNYQFVVTI